LKGRQKSKRGTRKRRRHTQETAQILELRKAKMVVWKKERSFPSLHVLETITRSILTSPPTTEAIDSTSGDFYPLAPIP
jgi:hypothetical protein